MGSTRKYVESELGFANELSSNGDLASAFHRLERAHVGAATKTPLGNCPRGKTGGANVWFFKPMPINKDLAEILDTAK